MLPTITARDIQREYKKVIDEVQSTNKPIVLITRNRPVAAIISIELLDRLQKITDTDEYEIFSNEEIKQFLAHDKLPDKLASETADFWKRKNLP